MVRKLAGCIAIIALLVCAVPAVSADATQHFGPFASVTPDNGTCQNSWATDTVNRDFMVKSNKDGSFTVREEFKDGTFVTNAGPSPGGCENDNHHGSTVKAGVTGSFHGNLEGVVTGGTFNPNGCSANPSACTTTAGFITATFGSAGQFSCSVGFGSCTFEFHYAAGDQGLIFHEWKEITTKDQTTEIDSGDIANA
jgi:hypothetical protein